MDPRIDQIVKGLKDYFKKAGFEKAVLGLSGGVDSALTAKFAVMALGKENVTALILPCEGMSSDHSLSDAENWAEILGIHYEIIPIADFVAQYQGLRWPASEEAKINVQARVRMTILYHYANSHKALVLGTDNKTEAILGYFTKYGDGGVDVLPIASLYKTDVWKLAEELGIPEAIIKKVPSAELSQGQTDEGEIGMSYAEVDEILKKFEAGGVAETDKEKKLQTRIEANRHKGQLPPVVQV